ncbi:MAG: hypothetical protein JJU45_01025 [Acidimicrobiia bacterium]|nr:hypothetical protein [Acidimicrobiia bacterium]
MSRTTRTLAALASASVLALGACATDDDGDVFDTTEPTDGPTTTMPPDAGFDQPGPMDEPGDGPVLDDGDEFVPGDPDAGAL